MESSAATHKRSVSDSAVKIVNSFKDFVTAVLGVVSTPLTIAVIVLVALAAFNDYERWSHRDAAPARAHELAMTKAQAANALALEIVRACQSKSVALWTCVGATKRELGK